MEPDIQKRAPKPRPGRRGAGSKAACDRSETVFAREFDQVASDRAANRVKGRNARAEKRRRENADGTTAKKAAAYQDACLAIVAGRGTPEHRALVDKADKAAFFAGGSHSADDQSRIFDGYKWPGGFIAGRYQKPFVERLLRSWAHPFLKRFAASCAPAGELMAGNAKDACKAQWSKLHALDMTYCFFNFRCEELTRIDGDKFADGRDMAFENEAALRAWIAYIVNEHDLPCGPHVVSWIWDDNREGWIIRPQFWFLLPETKAVWFDKSQHRMFGQVAAALTRAFGGDPGGLALLGHGKNPLSPHTGVIIFQDTHMPTLAEYAQALDLSWDPEVTARKIAVERLTAGGFDAGDSNTYFSLISKACHSARIELHKAGASTPDIDLFRSRIAAVVRPVAFAEIEPRGRKQIDAVDEMIATCAKWSSATFDPDKTDPHRDRGAAAHLMSEGDDAKTRMQKGQTHGAGSRVANTRALIVAAIKAERKSGREPTIASVTELIPRSYNTVKAHFFACFVTVVATEALAAIRGPVEGVPPRSDRYHPSTDLLLKAIRPSQVPDDWADPVLAEHFRQQALREARHRRRKRGGIRTTASVQTVGLATLNFLSGGPVVRHKPTVRLAS